MLFALSACSQPSSPAQTLQDAPISAQNIVLETCERYLDANAENIELRAVALMVMTTDAVEAFPGTPFATRIEGALALGGVYGDELPDDFTHIDATVVATACVSGT